MRISGASGGGRKLKHLQIYPIHYSYVEHPRTAPTVTVDAPVKFAKRDKECVIRGTAAVSLVLRRTLVVDIGSVVGLLSVVV